MTRPTLFVALALLATGCPTDPTPEPPPEVDYADALEWAIAVADSRGGREIVRDDAGDSLHDETCPELTEDTVSEMDPEDCPSYAPEGVHTVETLERLGGCATGDGYAVSGTWSSLRDVLTCNDEEDGPRVVSSWTLEADGFGFDLDEGAELAKDWSTLDFDGSLFASATEMKWAFDPYASRYWSVDLAATAAPNRASAVLLHGTTTVELTGDRGWSGGDSDWSDWGHQLGRAETTGPGRSWEALIDLTWDHHETKYDEEGCWREPARGTIGLVSSDPATGDVLWSLVLEFDGETECDGCGELVIEGVSAGLWCEADLDSRY